MARSFKKYKRKAQKTLKTIRNLIGGILTALVLISIFWPAMDTGVDLPFGTPEDWLNGVLDQTDLAPASGIALPESGPFVCALDVGQGDAVLIGDSGHYALIDTGTSSSADEMIAALGRLGVEKLELLVLTHPHADHIGGAGRLLDEVPVEEMLLPNSKLCKKVASFSYEKLLRKAQEMDIPMKVAQVGDRYTFGSSTLEVIGAGVETKDNLNQLSPAIRFDGPGLSFLDTGDGEKEVEQALLASGEYLRADVFKAAHHGSDTSNTSEFLAQVMPKVVLISCGKDNDYGHPHQGPMARFQMLGAQILRTDEQGILLVAPAADGQSLNTWVSGADEAA